MGHCTDIIWKGSFSINVYVYLCETQTEYSISNNNTI